MLPRNNKKRRTIFFFVLFVSLFLFSPVQAENLFIKFFQAHISAADGDRCRMYPSCSAYASRAIEKHGSVLGWVMACDRLVRCGRDETKVSMTVVAAGREYTYDPVEANDFWWFEKEKKE